MAGLVSSDTLGPGESGTIRVTLDPAGKFGQVIKTVTITTNDPARPQVAVPVYATVLHGVDPESGTPLEETLFGQKQCAACHAAPAGDLLGAKLYIAICKMCHGPLEEWAASVPAERRTREELHRWTAYGEDGTSMPGYLDENGGPLTEEQVDSLVSLVVGVEE